MRKAMIFRWALVVAAGFGVPPGGAADGIAEGTFLVRGRTFSLGPYGHPLPAAPVELHAAGSVAREGDGRLAVAELDGEDRTIAVYGGTAFAAPGRSGWQRISFAPFPLPDGESEWPKGRVRRFRLRSAAVGMLESVPPLLVEQSERDLVVRNPWYRIALAPVHAPLSGSARRLIRKIAFPGGREFVPGQTVSNLTVRDGGSEKIREWHFDPERPPAWERQGPWMATVTYHGGYDGVDVPWRADFTFYAELPLIRIRFERQRRDDRNLGFGLGRSMQVYFDPQAPGWPVGKDQVAQSRSEWNSLSIMEEPTGQIAFLLPDGRTSGLTHRAATWGYLCASWEAAGYRPFRTGDEDIREFYLFLAEEPESGESLGCRVAGLRTLSEADWHVRTHALFE